MGRTAATATTRATAPADVPWRTPREGIGLTGRSDELAVSVPLRHGDRFLIGDAMPEAAELVMTLPLDWADAGAATETLTAIVSPSPDGKDRSLRRVHWWTSAGTYLPPFAGMLTLESEDAREPASLLVLQGAYTLPRWALDFEADAMLARRLAVFAAHALLAELAKRLLVHVYLRACAPAADPV